MDIVLKYEGVWHVLFSAELFRKSTVIFREISGKIPPEFPEISELTTLSAYIFSTFAINSSNCFYFRSFDRKFAMKKSLRETQTLRAGCSKAEPKNFAPLQTPFPGARDGQNLISWRWSIPYLKTQFGEDRCMQFWVIVVTDLSTHKHTQPQTDRTDYNTLHRS